MSASVHLPTGAMLRHSVTTVHHMLHVGKLDATRIGEIHAGKLGIGEFSPTVLRWLDCRRLGCRQRSGELLARSEVGQHPRLRGPGGFLPPPNRLSMSIVTVYLVCLSLDRSFTNGGLDSVPLPCSSEYGTGHHLITSYFSRYSHRHIMIRSIPEIPTCTLAFQFGFSYLLPYSRSPGPATPSHSLEPLPSSTRFLVRLDSVIRYM